MLSNHTTTLHARQRQHRRQNSTPSAFEGVKPTAMPNRRPAVGHRRGLSLDTRQMRPTTATRHGSTVSMSTNNTGLANLPQHRVLREAQQQRTQARPGPQQHHSSSSQYVSMTHENSENFLLSPHDTPQLNGFDASCFDSNSAPFAPFGEQLTMMMQKNHGSYGSNMTSAKDMELFQIESAQTTPTYMNYAQSPSDNTWTVEEASATIKRSARRISNGIMDRVAKFEGLGVEDGQRPTTPPNQNGSAYFPPTPMETPHDRALKQQPRQPARFSEDYDDSMEETLKPNRSRPHARAQDIFNQTSQSPVVPSPPRTAPIPASKTFSTVQQLHAENADYLDMNGFRSEFMKLGDGFEGIPDDAAEFLVSQSMSVNPSQESHHMANFDFDEPASVEGSPVRRVHGHRRTESVASIASAASIASINIEETKTDTGVTLEEISQFIRGPDSSDGKWMCLFEDCGKKFGRKENIKSHVQTHLNDRQYQCPTCNKCFVRQHDLKRHAKIHTGIKPYPCECGNSFARHDALTRHRQRGMCIGAFDGIVRKVVKRGRPKKNRPDMEARMEKSARTRRNNNLSISSSVSSFSGYSDSSAANSPENDYNVLDDMMDIGAINMQPSLSSAPMTNIVRRAENVTSPADTLHSYVSPEAIMDASAPASPAKSATSQYNTPPELSQSSSPPPAGLFEVNEDLSALTDNSAMMNGAGVNTTLPIGINENDDPLMLQFAQDDGLVQLERDPSMLMMSKFDEEFGMFTNGDDVFFPSS